MPRVPNPLPVAHYRRPNPWPARIASALVLVLLAGVFLLIVR
jgi:hypothetical protein